MDSKAAARSIPPSVLWAWLVHLLTASGAVLALLALWAIEEENWRLALLWLLAALAVDGIDGTLARAMRVKEVLPRVDGATLDLVVDYLTYVFVPTILIWRAGLVPPSLAPLLAAGILISALYVFARTDMKTQDGYFRGFPALWNVVALYLFVLQLDPAAGAAVVVLLAALSFAPVHFVHPFRVRDYGLWLPLLSVVWAGCTAGLLWPELGATARNILLACGIPAGALLLALGVLRSVRGAPRDLRTSDLSSGSGSDRKVGGPANSA